MGAPSGSTRIYRRERNKPYSFQIRIPYHRQMSHAAKAIDASNLVRSTRLTIVVGAVDCSDTIDECLDALTVSCSGIEYEVVVVDASTDGSAELALRHGDVTVLKEPPGTLVPVLWARGIAMARGDVVALTIGTFVVGPSWATALVAAIGNGSAGAGGPIRLSPSVPPAESAVYFLRYSSYLPTDMGNRDVADIAGDNAAYSMAVLQATEWNEQRGFWESEINRSLRGAGHRLTLVPDAEAAFMRGPRVRTFCAQRFAHGRLFGRWRVETGGESRLGILVRAPLVPFVLTFRIASRTASHIQYRSRFVRSFPVLAWFAICWAAGEAVGAWEAAGPDTSQNQARVMTRGG